MRKIEIDKQQLEYVIKTFKYKKDAAKYLGIGISTLNKNLKSANLTYPCTNYRKGKYFPKTHSYIDKNWLLENWVNTSKSIRQLAEEENINIKILENRCIRWGIKKHFCYPLNTEKLFDISDPHVWYLAGLIATDGYVPKGQNAVEIDLKGSSEEILLNDIHKYFELTSPVQNYNNSTRIRIATEGLNEFLKCNFNIPDGPKTFTVEVPSKFINEDCAKAYFRGCLDGDGYIYAKGKCFTILSASEIFVDGLVNLLNTYLNCAYIKSFERYPLIRAQGNKCKSALTWAYSLENCFVLNRKYSEYNKLMI